METPFALKYPFPSIPNRDCGAPESAVLVNQVAIVMLSRMSSRVRPADFPAKVNARDQARCSCARRGQQEISRQADGVSPRFRYNALRSQTHLEPREAIPFWINELGQSRS